MFPNYYPDMLCPFFSSVSIVETCEVYHCLISTECYSWLILFLNWVIKTYLIIVSHILVIRSLYRVFLLQIMFPSL